MEEEIRLRLTTALNKYDQSIHDMDLSKAHLLSSIIAQLTYALTDMMEAVDEREVGREEWKEGS